jgi:hypothetical protein
MKKTLFALAVMFGVGLALTPRGALSQPAAQPTKGLPINLGPGDQGATLKSPFGDAPGSPAPPTGAAPPSYIQGLLKETGATQPADAKPATASSLLPYDTAAINNDILVTPDQGPWMVLITSYSGPEGPMRARKMVAELRSHYKLPAYVFNYGAEQKREELERVKAMIEKQKQELQEIQKKTNVTLDQPIRVRHLKIEEHFGVLVGGYSSEEAADKVRAQLKKLDPPDPSRVDLDMKFVANEGSAKESGEAVKCYVNPFERTLVVRNPALPKFQRPADWDKVDVEALRRMNSEEPLSLLKCNKAFTLVIKEFSLPSITTPRNAPASGGFWDALGLGKKGADSIDVAADNAHKFAEALRKAKLDAYVLHTKYSSLVTVGGFDSLEDPNLRSMQNLLQTRLMANPQMAALQLFPEPRPMQIPR